MPDSIDKYLDPAGLDETVLNIRQLTEALEEEMQNLPYALPDGLYPDMTVGAVIGADETAQWAMRECTVSGTAIVRSVQGAAVGWNQLVRNVGVSREADGFTLTVDGGSVTVSGTNSSDQSKYITLSGYNAIGDGIKSGNKYLLTVHNESVRYYANVDGFWNPSNVARIVQAEANGTISTGVILVASAGATFDGEVFTPQLFDLTQMFGSGSEPTTVAEFEQMYPASYYPYSAPTLTPVRIAGIASTDAQGGELDAIEWTAQTLRAAGSVRDELTADELVTRVGERAYQSGDESDATVRTDGATTYYPLTTPTTTPISPALPMTYRVQTGGSESIIVPTGEVSAAPVLTVAEPVNAGDEFARIWAAIQSLGYTRNTAQLSRPVSLTDIGSIDEVQKDTAEIDTIKEVTE